MTEQGRVTRQEGYSWRKMSANSLKYWKEELKRSIVRKLKREGVIVVEDEKPE